jgi:L-alanine-DL-glutamate epimerase-like enolase superfamily enzyme
MATLARIGVRVFRTQWRSSRDAHGHRHPGPLSDTEQAVLTLVDSDGAEGCVVTTPANLRQEAIEKSIMPRLVGRPVFSAEAMNRDITMQRRGNPAELTDRRIALFDMALWDLIGKKCGQPIWRLLGGAHDRVRAYASTMVGDDIPGGLSTPQDYADFAERLVDQGYTAIKLHTWFPPSPGAPSVERDIAACEAVRSRVGDGIELMLDGYHWYSRAQAVKIGRALDRLNFEWFEEPMYEASMSSYRWLSAQLDTLVIGPETVAGQHFARGDWAMNEAVDILRVSPENGGGILSTLKTLHLAESMGIGCEVHGNGAASLHMVAATTVPKYYERGLLHPQADYDWLPPHLAAPIDPLDRDGFVSAPTGPGLGVEIDWDHVRSHAVHSFEVSA